MTPQEQQLVNDLFDRLAEIERNPRDGNAERLIADGLQRAPHAVYALVQTVLVQDEALKRANAHIEELQAQLDSGETHRPQGGFLDSMRDAVLGRRDARGSVPSVQSRSAASPPPGPQAQAGYPRRRRLIRRALAWVRAWVRAWVPAWVPAWAPEWADRFSVPRRRLRRAPSAVRCCSTASARCSAVNPAQAAKIKVSSIAPRVRRIRRGAAAMPATTSCRAGSASTTSAGAARPRKARRFKMPHRTHSKTPTTTGCAARRRRRAGCRTRRRG